MSNISIRSALDFAPAGVTFRIVVDLPEDQGQGARITISPVNSATGAEVPIREDSSPVLVDFAPAFNRWIRTRRVAGTVGESSITGTFHEDVSIEDLLRYTADICDMIQQRFSLYEEKVLV